MVKTKTSPKVKKTRRKRSKSRVVGLGLQTAGVGGLGLALDHGGKGLRASLESKDAGRIAKEFDNAHTKMWRGGVPQTLVRGDKSYVVDNLKRFKDITTKLRTESDMFREKGTRRRSDALRHLSKARRLGVVGLATGLTGLGVSALGSRKTKRKVKK